MKISVKKLVCVCIYKVNDKMYVGLQGETTCGENEQRKNISDKPKVMGQKGRCN